MRRRKRYFYASCVRTRGTRRRRVVCAKSLWSRKVIANLAQPSTPAQEMLSEIPRRGEQNILKKPTSHGVKSEHATGQVWILRGSENLLRFPRSNVRKRLKPNPGKKKEIMQLITC